MNIRMPPRYYTTPTRARYRKFRLPTELWQTWELVNALAWVNEYRCTPPTALHDLGRILLIKEDAVRDRLAKLVEYGWLKIEREIGKSSIYIPLVPEDTADSCGAVHMGDAASLIPPDASEDSSARPGGTEGEGASPHGDGVNLDYRGSNSVVAVVDGISEFGNEDNLKTQPTATTSSNNTRTRDEIYRIEDALADLGIETDEARVELMALAHVTPEYVEDWVMTKQRLESNPNDPVLGGGYYRRQIRAGRRPTYSMSRRQRKEYRSRKDDDWEMDAIDEAGDSG